MEALLVIDVQNDFCPGGALPVPEGDAVVPVINRLMTGFDLVVLTQDWHPAGHASFASSHPGKAPYETTMMPYGEQVLWPDHCVQGSRGAAFHPDLNVDRADVIVRKGTNPLIDSYSAFYENDRRTPTGLAGYLKERGVTRLYLTGLALDFCVAWSAIDGRHLGMEVIVVEEATRAIDTGGSLQRARQEMAETGAQLSAPEVLPGWRNGGASGGHARLSSG